MVRSLAKQYRCVLVFLCLFAPFSPVFLLESEARDLTDVLLQGFSFNAFGRDTTLAAREVSPAFSSAIAQTVAQRFPLASVAPAFSLRHNPELDIWETVSGVPGPLFSERALTLGKGTFNFSIGYAFIDFSDFNGTDLDNIRSPALVNEIFVNEGVLLGRLSTGEGIFAAPASVSLIRSRLDLDVHVVAPTLRYGVTDHWEVGMSLPVVNTSLRVRNDAVRVADINPSAASAVFLKDAQGNITEFVGFASPEGRLLDVSQVPFTRTRRPTQLLARAAGTATGIGDITLRTKYEFWPSRRTEGNYDGGAAVGLTLQLPSGEVRNFHGTDQVYLTPFFYLSQVFRNRFEAHLNVGVELNTEDIDRSSFLYAVGGTLLVGHGFGIIVDFLGRSEFKRFAVHVPPAGIFQEGVTLDRKADTCTVGRPCFIDRSKGFRAFPFFPVKIRRNDIADFSFGLRYALGEKGSIFFGAIVPLNSDGLRADFIPSGGIEYTF